MMARREVVGLVGFPTRRAVAACAVLLSIGVAGAVHAQTLPPCTKVQSDVTPFEEVTTLSSAIVPQEWSFNVGTAGTYEVKLTDLGQNQPPPIGPAPLASLELALTRGPSLVDLPVSGAQTAHFALTAGAHVVHVVGEPGAQSASGPFNVQIREMSTSQMVLDCSSSISAPQTIPDNQRLYQSTFRLAAPGTYEITLADLKFPQALETVGLFVFKPGASQLAAFIPTASDPPQPQIFTLDAGDYEIVAAGALASGAGGGLFSVHVRNASSGEVIHTAAVQVGRVQSLGDVVLDSGGHVLKLKDLQFPAALQSRTVILTRAAQTTVRASEADPEDVPFTVIDTSRHQVFAYGTADSTAGAGTYYVDVRRTGGTPLLASVRAVADSSGVPATYAFSFSPENALAAGSYRLTHTDFQFDPFTSARLAVVQDGIVLGSTPTNAGGPVRTLDLPTVAAGRPTAVVVVRPGTTSTPPRGLFGLDMVPTAGGSAVLDVTQGVGGLFQSRRIPIVDPGRHDVHITDLEFPAQFRGVTAVLTRGTQKLGTFLVSGGTAEFAFDATAGNYFVTFVAEPDPETDAGTYAMTVAKSPPLPVITLSASPQRVRSGNTTTLTWTTQNATSCSGDGAWTGTKELSGSQPTAALTAASTFTLRCRGAGVDSERSTSVTVELETAQQESGGGGGAFSVPALILLSLLTLARPRRLRLAS